MNVAKEVKRTIAQWGARVRGGGQRPRGFPKLQIDR